MKDDDKLARAANACLTAYVELVSAIEDSHIRQKCLLDALSVRVTASALNSVESEKPH